ncbi:MAG: type II toxin-antitoxin system RelE/ParE family toxin [Candidatus Hinthialibacter antarcticus]|nr:type II toxin-antitoxin system RelE/ParE family toxin [Candidatus Hinthialibacter antarcticus]
MKRKIVWSPEAVDDVESIYNFIARDSNAYAKSVVDKIIQTVKFIPDHPYAGRIVPEINQETVREKLVFSYRLIYKISETEILIVTVLHDKRLL